MGNIRNSYSDLQEIMLQFAENTGLTGPSRKPERYLWTDAFAVCNFLELYRQTGDQKFLDLGRQLVSQVHWILGRHRPDDGRKGWISGLDEEEGKDHPTRGGLRIGKELNERKWNEPSDPDLEWDRDGQYYHYLTKWMHALVRVSRVTNDRKYILWAIELARAIHSKFTYVPERGGPGRMYWKMSIDLSYPLVTSMGHHDPLDGLITYLETQSVTHLFSDPSLPDLYQEISEMRNLCQGKEWATHDPLGLGGLLSDAFRLTQLVVLAGNTEFKDLLHDMLGDTRMGLGYFAKNNQLSLSANYRLAFRELGLAIGLKAIRRMDDFMNDHEKAFIPMNQWELLVESLKEYLYLVDPIEGFWKQPENQESLSWREHENINRVMLGTCLAPDGFLSV